MKTQRRGLPDDLWFRFPQSSNPALSSAPFVVSLLLLAMQKREPIEVRGYLSKRLFQGLSEYQDVYHSWFPERFHKIEILPEGLREEPLHAGRGEACAFSGGVDSFYTFLKLRSRITDVIFMGGFDTPLHLEDSTAEMAGSFGTLMKERDVRFIHGSTNVRAFVNSVDWTNAHGQALAASALFFRDSIQKFHVPSSYRDGSYPKWGTHPVLDPLLSTEALEFVHHGSDANRVAKLQELIVAPETYERLRVCWVQSIGLRNCGECEKCVRTMVALEILGARERYATFAPGSLTRSKVRGLVLRTRQSRIFARELLWEAARRGRWSTCADLAVALLRREWFYRGRLLQVPRSHRRSAHDTSP